MTTDNPFQGVLYAPLLRLVGDADLERIAAGARHPNGDTWTVKYLAAELSWRQHIVGAVASLFLAPAGNVVDALWKAVDAGSWVTPQLVVVAFRVDPQFAGHAQVRIDNRCMPQRARHDPSTIAGHHTAGPGGDSQRAGKLLASILHMCRHSVSLSSWADEVMRLDWAPDCLAADVDSSARICSDWNEHLVEQFEVRGWMLPAVNEH